MFLPGPACPPQPAALLPRTGAQASKLHPAPLPGVAPVRPAHALPTCHSPPPTAPRRWHAGTVPHAHPSQTGVPGLGAATPPDCPAGAVPSLPTTPPAAHPPTLAFAAAGTSGGTDQKEAPRRHLLPLWLTLRSPPPTTQPPGHPSPSRHPTVFSCVSLHGPVSSLTARSITKSTCSHTGPGVAQHPGWSCVPRRSGLWRWPASPWALTLGSPAGYGILGTAQLTGLRRHPTDVRPRFLLTSWASSPVLGSELTPTARGLTGPHPAQSRPSGCVPSPVPVATRGPCPGPVPSSFVPPPPLSGSTPPASPQARHGRTHRTLAS